MVAATGGNLRKRIRRLLNPKAVGAWSPLLTAIVVIGTAVAAFAAWPTHNNQVGASLLSGQDAVQRAQLEEVRFVGVTQLDPDAVNNCAESLKAATYVGPTWQEAPVNRARTLWQDHGYYKVQITPEFQRLPDRDGLPQYALTLTVNEGAQYRLAGISFRNNQAFSSSELRQMFPIADGDLFSRDAVVQGMTAVHRAYVDRDYSNWVGVPQMQVDEVNHTVAMVLNVQEDATDQTTRISESVATSNLIHRVDPVYPEIAKAARIEGNNVYQIVVGKDGTVRYIQAVSGHPMLVQAGMEALRQWQFKPFLLNGQPVEFSTQVTIPFRLSEAR